jgi:hypothetical protein
MIGGRPSNSATTAAPGGRRIGHQLAGVPQPRGGQPLKRYDAMGVVGRKRLSTVAGPREACQRAGRPKRCPTN